MTRTLLSDVARERVMSKIRVLESGCWQWTGTRFSTGYGRIYVGGRSWVAHRLVYELLVGPIPDGATIDHLCHNRDPECNLDKRCAHRACVNPAHLEPVPIKVNILRGKGRAAVKARQTHCERGHLLAGENLRVNRDGSRVCRTCAALVSRAYNQTRRRKSYNRELRQGEKRKAYVRDWNARNAEKTAEYQRRYREKHAEELRARRAARQAADPEREREYVRRYRERNREELRAKRRAYREANLEAVRAKDREAARRRREAKRAQSPSA